MKEPSVTILVTLKNAASTIKPCIDSLLKLDYNNYEILVVDAFSTDGSYEILKKYGKKIKLYQVRGWAPVAYNWALRKIKTKYVALIDSDNVVPRDWIKKIIKGFDSPDVLEVAGFCASPKNVSTLQYLLGRELEDRYEHFGKYLSRAPTMNVMIRTDIAKKLKFNEKLRVGYDTDFSFRLTKIGKIRYVPEAKVLHYHRASWSKFFRQQYITAISSVMLYTKYPSKAGGDEISKTSMIMQPLLTYLCMFFLILGFFQQAIFNVAALTFLSILAIWIYDAVRLSKKIQHFFWYLAIFFVRNVAWCIGILIGIKQMLIH
ncbi:MAG: glycosyltransferase [Candidatus Micrarchaeia archaeon]